MTDAADVYNPKDFESIRLTVHFQNLTTRTEVKDKSKASLVEIGDKTLVFELPARSCNEKHNVMVKISRTEKIKDGADKSKKAPKEQELLNVTGKVRSLEEVDEETVRIEVECMQFDEKGWNALLALYASRQAEIEKFLAAARGY